MSQQLLFGHRGCWDNYPQNTIGAFQDALAYGAEGIELDVHETSDGELLVFHDDRLNAQSPYWATLTYAEGRALLSEHDLRGPRLSECLAALPSHTPIILEIKSCHEAQRVLDYLQHHPLPQGSRICTFKMPILRALSKANCPYPLVINSSIASQQIWQRLRALRFYLWPHSLPAFCSMISVPGYLLTKRLVNVVHASHRLIGCWADEVDMAQRAVQMGVDILMTKRVKELAEFMGKHQG